MSNKHKFLVLNPSPEGLDKVIEKANLQNQKIGPFEAILLLGDVLPAGSSIPSNEIQQSTFFTQGINGISENVPIGETESRLVDVKSNLTYMKGPFTKFKLASGLTIAYLAGTEITEEIQQNIEKEIGVGKVDILVTYNWPYAIAKQRKLLLVANNKIDSFVKKIKPRYHFAVGNERGRYLENEPFKWDDETITRFISLGQEGSGEKWFYAFEIANNLTQVSPAKLAENPFTIKIEDTPEPTKRPIEDVDKDIAPAKKAKVVTPDQCFFCLSNPKVETHMIISIGSYTYMTVAKGPLTRPSKNLPFSGHAIIIPIEHMATLRNTTADVIESPIYQEIVKYQDSLVKAFAISKPFLKLVFFEINRKTNVHQHVQFLPVGENLIEAFPKALEEKSKLNNENFERNQKLNFEEFKDINDPKLLEILNNTDYIAFTICHNESDKTVYIAQLKDESKAIDLQFPRRVLAYTLKCPKRTYWDKCQQSKYKETQECEEFKNFYKEYDFTK